MKDLAFKIIKKAFDGKTDKGGHPYIDHLKRVSDNCPDIGDVKTVALLHDLLEDCPEWSAKALRTFFTDDVVDSVIALTQGAGQSYKDYIGQVLENEWATIVKRHDLKDNMDITRLTELTQKDFDRLKKYHEAYLRIIKKVTIETYIQKP